MKNRTKLIYVLVFNLLTALSLCTAAQALAIAHGAAPGFSFTRLALNFCIAYPVAVLLGLVFPSERFGKGVCALLHIKPGLLYGVGMNVSINLVYTAVLSGVMGFFNVMILNHQGLSVFVSGFLGDFLPMLLVSCLVSAVFNAPVMRLAAVLAGQVPPTPDRHEMEGKE